MYIDSIFIYLSFKDKIRFASIDKQYREQIFLKNKPIYKDIEPHLNNSNKIKIITKTWFNNKQHIMYLYYNIYMRILIKGNINMFNYTINLKNNKIKNMMHEAISGAISGDYIISKRLSKKILNLKRSKRDYDHFLISNVYTSLSTGNVRIINNLYHSFSHVILTPKYLYRISKIYKYHHKFLQWMINMRDKDTNIDSILRNLEKKIQSLIK